MLTLNKLNNNKELRIIGMASNDINKSYGNVSLTISDITWLNFTIKNVSFGRGTVLANSKTCDLNSTGFVNASGACQAWVNTAANGLVIKNIGNNNVTLNLTWRNYSRFFSKTATARLAFKIINGNRTIGSTPGCKGQTMTSFNRFNNTWQQVGTHEWWSNITCDNMYYGATANAITVHVKITIPGDPQVLTGVRRNTLMAVGKAI